MSGTIVSQFTGNSGTGGPIEVIFLLCSFFAYSKLISGPHDFDGLSVVHGIVESLEGYCRVHSGLGEGTVFSIYFPLTDRTRDEDVPGTARTGGRRDR